MTSIPEQIKQDSLKKLIGIAKEMLNGTKNLAEGSRDINTLRYNIEDSENDIFNIFLLISSDTDHIPLKEELRKKWNQEALKKLDKELDEYIIDMKPQILKACEEIIRKLSSR